MKKYFILFAAICAAVAVSCTPKELAIDTPVEEGVSDVKMIPITITASFEGTKADMVDVAWTWKEGDKLAVYDGTDKREFTLDASAAGTAVAKFTGEVAETYTSLQAVFPYEAAGAAFDTPLIPAVQTVASGTTIDPKAMIAVAERAEQVAEDEFNFYFTSGVSMLRFTVSDGVQKVILHTEGKEAAIAGESRSVTVNVPGAGQYWAAVNPAAYEGMKVFARTSNGDFLKSTASTIDLSAPGKAKNLGTLGTGTQVSVIEDGAELVSYLDSTPTLDAYVVNDLDLTGQTVTTCANFAKVFDGLYHSIKNWTSNGVALFGNNTGTISNITLDESCTLNLPTSLNGYFGFIVCQTSGPLSGLVNYADVTSTAAITAAARVGMVAGWSGSVITVSKCENHGDMYLTLTDGNATSMFAGVMSQMGAEGAAMEDCVNTGNITIDLDVAWEEKCNLYVGGVAGQTSSKANNIRLRNEGNVSFNAPDGILQGVAIGGCTSYTTGNITDCYNSGNISFVSGAGVKATLIGGLAGYMAAGNKVLSGSINTGNVSFEAAFQCGYNNMGDIKYDTNTDGTPKDSNTAVYKCGVIVGGLIGATAAKSLKFNSSENRGDVSIAYTDPMNTNKSINTAGRPTVGGCIGDCWGTVDGLKNYGKVSASLTSGETGSDTFVANNAGYTVYIGGVVGAGYLVKSQDSFSISNSENHGEVHLHSLNQQANYTNHAIGGIVGWPGKESSNTKQIKNCLNDAIVKASGTINVRVGGIVGGSIGVVGCSNSGVVKLEGTTLYQTCSLGGIIGFQGNTYALQNCVNTGNVVSETTLNNKGGVGGFIGVLGNATNPNRYGGSVNCSITVPASNAEVGMLVGHYNGTNASPIGSEENTVSVGGSITKGSTTTIMTTETLTREFMFGAHANADAQEFYVTLIGS